MASPVSQSMSPVSRTRRALFTFMTMLLCWSAIVGISYVKSPVEDTISTNAIHVLGDIGTFVGIAYIGGSVVDYTAMFANLGRRFGVSIPWAHDQGGDQGGGVTSNEDKSDDVKV